MVHYRKDVIVNACYCISDRQEHKLILIQHAGPEQETILHLHPTARQLPLRQAISLGGRGHRAPADSSQNSLERTTREITTFFL